VDIPAVDIAGVDWPIPRISPDHFSVPQFTDIVKMTPTASPMRFQDLSSKISANAPFLWFYIACIDQRAAKPRSAAEVGRQATIFYGAKHVFIWITTWPEEHFAPLIGLSPLTDQVFEEWKGDVPAEYKRFGSDTDGERLEPNLGMPSNREMQKTVSRIVAGFPILKDLSLIHGCPPRGPSRNPLFVEMHIYYIAMRSSCVGHAKYSPTILGDSMN
jgi:hypothetical protein